MADPGDRKAHQRRRSPALRRSWCCSFGVVPQSPDHLRRPAPAAAHRNHPPAKHHHPHPNPKQQQLPSGGSFQSSPSPSSSRIARGLIDPRRILSPGRVSPIDSDPSLGTLPEDAASVAATTVDSEPPRESASAASAAARPSSASSSAAAVAAAEAVGGKAGRLRVGLKGRDGRGVVLELDDPEVLVESSAFFAGMVVRADSSSSQRRDGPTVGVGSSSCCCRKIEVANIEDVEAFRMAIEMMYERDPLRWLMNVGVSRAIDLLEVSSTIMFDRGVTSCLTYLEAVPWSESEEEKLKSLLPRCKFDDAVVHDTLSRLYSQCPTTAENLGLHLIQSVTSGKNANSRKEMQSLVNGLLSKSSVYQKDPAGLDKEGLYRVCQSCLNALVKLFEGASIPDSLKQKVSKDSKPLIERVSKEVDNLNWLLEILIEMQIAEDFVGLWADQSELVRLHETASPMVRYELSRVSACIFMALGRGRLQCRGDVRHHVLTTWFGPMLSDFGWLQRCSKGLDMRMLEEGLGQTLLMLSLKQQQSLFMEWFKCFSGRGTECPNLSRAFQIWWRRSFVKFPEAITAC